MSPGHAVDPVSADSLSGFDHECDVLVVGFGCAGAAAAFEAASAGADVVVLDRAGGPGGASALSGGELYLGGGTPVQRACGFEDTAEDMFAYLEAALGPYPDREKLRLYCDGSTEHFQWFLDRGLTFAESLYDAPSWMPPTKDGLMWLGENAWPYNTLARPAPRGHRPAAESFGGRLVMEKLVAAAGLAGAVAHTDTSATNLVVDDGGRASGVVARRYGERVTYRARRAVVLTTGGFVDSEEMLEQHAPVLLGHGKVSAGLDDGSGIRMASAIGAATRRMASVEIAMQVLPALITRGMLVNGNGQRFLNEDVYPGLISGVWRGTPGVHAREESLLKARDVLLDHGKRRLPAGGRAVGRRRSARSQVCADTGGQTPGPACRRRHRRDCRQAEKQGPRAGRARAEARARPRR